MENSAITWVANNYYYIAAIALAIVFAIDCCHEWRR